MPALRGLLFPFAAATALWACSSSIELKPLGEQTTSESENPSPGATDPADTSNTVPAGQVGDPSAGGELTHPTLAPPPGSGGSSGTGSPGTGSPGTGSPGTGSPGPAPMVAMG